MRESATECPSFRPATRVSTLSEAATIQTDRKTASPTNKNRAGFIHSAGAEELEY